MKSYRFISTICVVFFAMNSIAFDFSLVKKCSPQKMHSDAEKLLSNLAWLNFSPNLNLPVDPKIFRRISENHKADDIVFIGHNTYLANCSKYEIESITKKFSIAMRQGLSCLANLNKYRAEDAGILLNFFDKKNSSPLFIRCEANRDNEYMGRDKRPDRREGSTIGGEASAFVCTNNLYPGAIFTGHTLNKIITSAAKDDTSVFFHEMLHLLGYLHMDDDFNFWGHDFVKQVEGCCFPESIDRKLNPHMDLDNSCERLKNLNQRI